MLLKTSDWMNGGSPDDVLFLLRDTPITRSEIRRRVSVLAARLSVVPCRTVGIAERDPVKFLTELIATLASRRTPVFAGGNRLASLEPAQPWISRRSAPTRNSFFSRPAPPESRNLCGKSCVFSIGRLRWCPKSSRTFGASLLPQASIPCISTGSPLRSGFRWRSASRGLFRGLYRKTWRQLPCPPLLFPLRPSFGTSTPRCRMTQSALSFPLAESWGRRPVPV